MGHSENIVFQGQDSAFEAQLFQDLKKRLDVKILRMSGYNPKANGQCEKNNDTI